MGSQIILAPEAEQDLDEIVSYIANPDWKKKSGEMSN
jgi:plasmid stabilization system protein ParE